MLDSIYIGMSGLNGYSQGLRVIANNTANMNTPGFKSSSLQFADMLYASSGSGSGLMQVGYGLSSGGTTLNFQQGEMRQTGNSLDLAVDGQGLFTLRDESGNTHYTRAGQFSFDSEGVLVSRVDQSKVLGIGTDGALGEISIAGHATAAGKATANAKFAGNLSSTSTEETLGSVKIIDSAGGEHLLTVKLTPKEDAPGTWVVRILDGATEVGTGEIAFVDGRPQAAKSKVTVNYTANGLKSIPVTLDFRTDVTSFAAGTLSTLAFTSQDGYGPGSMTDAKFDDTGTLVMTYSNGQKVKGPRLCLGRFDSLDAVQARGNNQFDATNNLAWHTGASGNDGFGSIRSGAVELSNVDLSQEFSDLVIMQRGYQSASQVISTANDMLQELFTMKGK